MSHSVGHRHHFIQYRILPFTKVSILPAGRNVNLILLHPLRHKAHLKWSSTNAKMHGSHLYLKDSHVWALNMTLNFLINCNIAAKVTHKLQSLSKVVK